MRLHAIARGALLAVGAAACGSGTSGAVGAKDAGAVGANDAGPAGGYDATAIDAYSAPIANGSDGSTVGDASASATDGAGACALALDPGFGMQGIEQLPAPPNPHPYIEQGLTVQPDGKILLVGPNRAVPNDVLIARYNVDGSTDSTFGDGGIATLTPSSSTAQILGNAYPTAVAVQSDGKILVCGVDNTDVWFLFRLDAAGKLDPNFGADGYASAPSPSSRGWTILLRPNGTIVIVGDQPVSGSAPPAWVFLVAQYNATGKLDPTFGTGGSITTSFEQSASARSGVLQPDGKVVAGGNTSTPVDGGAHYRQALARYTTTGVLDSTFGSAGQVKTELGRGLFLAVDMALQPSGAIVVATSPQLRQATDDFWLLRYTPGGQLDPAFGDGGVTTTDFAGGSDNAVGLSLLSGSAVLMAGTATEPDDAGGVTEFGLARYTPEGDLDTAFGVGGRLVTRVPGQSQTQMIAETLGSDGKLVVSGESQFAAGPVLLDLARYACH